MAGLIDYVEWRGDIGFDVVPFNKIDALVLSQVIYLNYKDFLKPGFNEYVTFEDFQLFFDARGEKKFKKHIGPAINPDTYTLLKACSYSKRFGSLKISGFRDVYSLKKEEQFAAFTVSYKNWNTVVFRGTDETIIGWKEDFNMGSQDEVPAQKDALDYLTEAMGALKGKFYVCGHSKGGNEVLYSVINASNSQKKRILNAFNFDGPGVSKELLESSKYKSVSEKILSIYPECSIVGMIFNHPENFEIVESTEFIVMQHDTLSWGIRGTDFIHKEKFSEESVFFHATFNEFYAGQTKEQMQNITDKVFDLFLKAGVKTLSDLEKDKLQTSAKILLELTKLEKDEIRDIKHMANMFLKAGKGNFPLFNSFKVSLPLK